MMTDPPYPEPPSAGDAIEGFADFDELVDALARWSVSFPGWAPAKRVQSEWEQVAPRLDRARRELSRMLVVGVIGGTGTGKSTLVNALAGEDVSPAGDEARPTTVQPVLVAARDVDLSWLPVERLQCRVVRSDAAAVANIVIIDCPDPDTQPVSGGHDGLAHAVRPSESNRNRDLLEAVLPACDVLLLVSTAQKYRSWVVAREVAAFAPGRPLLFVQTHAARDPDIREDWRRELESQGFSVPRIFRLDAVEAGSRGRRGLEPEAGFRDLVAAIDVELVGRAARRVRRTGALDLAGWFLREARETFAPLHEPVRQLAAGVRTEQSRLERILAEAVETRLRSSRAAWQRILADEIVDRWHGGPFAAFLRAAAAIGGLWPRVRAASGGLVGRLLAGHSTETIVAGRDGWQAVAELGLSAADVEQSRSVLSGLATRARLAEPLVGRAALDESQVSAIISRLLDRTAAWLSVGVDRLVAARRGRLDGPFLRWGFELLFSALLAAVLMRAAWNFFVGHLWFGRPLDGGGFLQEAIIWVVVWGLALRWIVFSVFRAGLDGDIHTLVERLPEARLTDPLVADFRSAADAASRFLEDADRLARRHETLNAALAEPGGELGRLLGRAPSSGA